MINQKNIVVIHSISFFSVLLILFLSLFFRCGTINFGFSFSFQLVCADRNGHHLYFMPCNRLQIGAARIDLMGWCFAFWLMVIRMADKTQV
jgi:hypothetical protein